MNLNANQIAFILDAIDMFDDFGDYISEDGTYSLTEKEINLNANQIAFILDAIDMVDYFGDYISEDGTYSLTEKEINEFIEMLQTQLKENK